ncbi:DUF4870 family protein [Solimonas soli]|uniref:DUF4870 family protein n=1 Tax=Solimonas soli TaxID=413479 RepID=UPI0004AD5115|nr:DUF4870 domain-containing protein [Solimonas soli]
MDTATLIDDGPDASERERTTLIVAYVLQAISPFTCFLATIISLVISYIKVSETRNAYIRSHHRYLIRTFWWTLLWGLVFGALCWVLIGIPLLLGLYVWWIYRLVKGFIAYAERRAMPA